MERLRILPFLLESTCRKTQEITKPGSFLAIAAPAAFGCIRGFDETEVVSILVFAGSGTLSMVPEEGFEPPTKGL
jgi:hypothetical protein